MHVSNRDYLPTTRVPYLVILFRHGSELSILWNKKNQGQTLDDVEEEDGPWYPKCWPDAPSEDYITEIKQLVEEKLPLAQERRKERMDELSPFIKKRQEENVMKKPRNKVNEF